MACLVVCGDPVEMVHNSVLAEGQHEVRYTLGWDVEGAVPHADGGWLLSDDMEGTVHLTRGYLVSYSTELVVCEDADEHGTALHGVLSPRAHAGHPSDLSVNPAMVAQPRVEDLTDPRQFEWAAAILERETWCSVHYLVARGDELTLAMPGDVDLEGVSLYLEGSWRRADGSWEDFVLQTEHATGTIEDVQVLNTGEEGADVVITRSLGGLFSGVDFATMDDEARAQQVLRNLRNQVTIEVERYP
jgi:hypothetical protein